MSRLCFSTLDVVSFSFFLFLSPSHQPPHPSRFVFVADATEVAGVGPSSVRASPRVSVNLGTIEAAPVDIFSSSPSASADHRAPAPWAAERWQQGQMASFRPAGRAVASRGAGAGGGGGSGGFVPSVLEELLGSTLPRTSVTPSMSGSATPSGMQTPFGGGVGWGASAEPQSPGTSHRGEGPPPPNAGSGGGVSASYQLQHHVQQRAGGVGGGTHTQGGVAMAGMAGYWPSAQEIIARSRSEANSRSVSGKYLLSLCTVH